MLHNDLEESLRYVNPSAEHFKVYSLRFYELLIRASTEFESVSKEEENIPISESLPGELRIFPSQAMIAQGDHVIFSVLGFFPYEKTEEITNKVEFSTQCDQEILVFNDIENPHIAQALTVGECTIVARKSDIFIESKIQVIDANLKNLVLFTESTSLVLEENSGVLIPQYVALDAKAIFSNQMEADYTELVSWTSSDEEIGNLDKANPGLLQVKKDGNLTVSAKFGEIKSDLGLKATVAPKIIEEGVISKLPVRNGGKLGMGTTVFFKA